MSDKKHTDVLEKIATGIEGFDDITTGGLPLRRTTLLMGGPGCGKTVLALQMLVCAATRHGVPGIFVAFEENARQVSANAASFGWDMPRLEEKQIFFVDACMAFRRGEGRRIRPHRAARGHRGSAHVLNEVPFVIGPAGVEVGSANGVHPAPQPFNERVSTGIQRLDAMLGGGFYRGTNVLLTGSSGSGKSTIAGAFIEAACRRNERALFISFDENSGDIVRDLASMSIHLAPHLETGLLRMEAVRTEATSSEEHFMRIKRVIAEQQPRCVVIDPLSALARVGGGMAARCPSSNRAARSIPTRCAN